MQSSLERHQSFFEPATMVRSLMYHLNIWTPFNKPYEDLRLILMEVFEYCWKLPFMSGTLSSLLTKNSESGDFYCPHFRCFFNLLFQYITSLLGLIFIFVEEVCLY